MTRDPRQNPQPGDIVLQTRGRGKKAQRMVTAVDGATVRYVNPSCLIGKPCHIDYWRESTREAEVLVVAPAEETP